MGKLVYPSVLERIKHDTSCALINTYSDDFLDPQKRSRHYMKSLSIYDCIFTPRDVNFGELKSRGARRVLKFWKGFDPDLHFPERISAEERQVYGTDVVFVGHAEPSRIQAFDSVARRVKSMKVWGNTWDKFRLPRKLAQVVQFRPAESIQYRKALCGAKIAIQMLSRKARDTQSSRSFEIPACGTLMVAERTEDHLASFKEDKEAVFFSSTDELCDKIEFYLKHDSLREGIALAGHERSHRSGYSNHLRIANMLNDALQGLK